MAHTALAAVLVWIDPAFGIFAYIGFLYSYGLGDRWRIAGFTATALVVSAAVSGGYPSGRTGQALSYVLIDELAEANRRLAESMAENSQENLSPREIEVLKLVADGATNQGAARKLLVSETTIKTHLLHIYTKLGVRDRASAVATAYKRGLIS